MSAKKIVFRSHEIVTRAFSYVIILSPTSYWLLRGGSINLSNIYKFIVYLLFTSHGTIACISPCFRVVISPYKYRSYHKSYACEYVCIIWNPKIRACQVIKWAWNLCFQATLDDLSLFEATRYSEDSHQQPDDRVAVLEFELRKARETIHSLRDELTQQVRYQDSVPYFLYFTKFLVSYYKYGKFCHS